MGNNLKTLRISKGWTHDEAADAMGISRGSFIKLERGERKLHQDTLARAAKAFDVSREAILADDLKTAPAPIFMGERDLKVFAAAEGGPGEMVVSTEPIELVPRPWYLRSVRDGFAVLVVGESMVPAFDPGDIAVVNPRLPPLRGKDVILVRAEEHGEFRATIKRLVSWTPTHWNLLQFNPAKGEKAEFSLPRREWPKALRVVGKYSGG